MDDNKDRNEPGKPPLDPAAEEAVPKAARERESSADNGDKLGAPDAAGDGSRAASDGGPETKPDAASGPPDGAAAATTDGSSGGPPAGSPSGSPSGKGGNGGGSGKPPKRRSVFGRVLGVIIALLILAALVVGGWFGWQLWRQQQAVLQSASHAGAEQQQVTQDLTQSMQRVLSRLDAQQAALDSQRAKLADRQATGDQRMAAMQSQLGQIKRASGALQQRMTGVAQRLEALESALSSLSRQRATGLERMRLADVEVLLTLAGQRYKLLHDAAGALTALRIARKELARVDDPALAGVARTLEDEISALAATRPEARAGWIAELQALRQQWSSLPTPSLEPPVPENPGSTWARVKNALSSLVVVEDVSSSGHIDKSNVRLERQVAKIQLAQAQAALLSRHPERALAALERVRGILTGEGAPYDLSSQAVAQARSRLDHLIGELRNVDKVDVQLGAALTALRNQRHVRRMNGQTPSQPGSAEQP